MLNAIVKNRFDDYVQCFAWTSTPTAENRNIYCDHFPRSVSVSALGRRNNSVCALFRAWSRDHESSTLWARDEPYGGGGYLLDEYSDMVCLAMKARHPVLFLPDDKH